MNLSDLKKIWQENDFHPRKMGQNFLIDKNIRDKILELLTIDKKCVLIEIGTGFGVMTFELAKRCKKVFTIEKDPRICEIIGPLMAQEDGIILINDDALKVDLCSLGGRDAVTVFGNIPYYISTPLIERIITQRHCIDNAFIVMQEELAERIVARPGSKIYGALSIYVQFYAEAEKIFKIKKNSFYPKPKVDSCLVGLSLLHEPSVRVKDERLMFSIIRSAFSQRRKKIINSLSGGALLSGAFKDWQSVLIRSGIDPASRAENLSISDYAKLADNIVMV